MSQMSSVPTCAFQFGDKPTAEVKGESTVPSGLRNNKMVCLKE